MSFFLRMEMRQECVMLSWLFNIFYRGIMREIKALVGNVCARLKLNVMSWSVVAYLHADDTVLLAKCEEKLQKMMNEL